MITILTAVLPALIAVLGSVFGNLIVQSKSGAVMQTKIDDMKEDIKTLSDRVNSHNNFGLKLERLETKIETIEKEMKK